MLSSVCCATLLVGSALSLPTPAEVMELPGFGTPQTKQFAGQFNVNSTCGANLFFWMVESEIAPATAPTVIWFNGGPGSSSFIGFFKENGPYHIVKKEEKITLEPNPYSWNQRANYLLIDQPAGTGLSFTDTPLCYAATEGLASDQLYTGIRMFMKKFPQYALNPLFIASESYGGHFVPGSFNRCNKHLVQFLVQFLVVY
jgi:carboxypeptidase C (cathepsin A)